MSDFHLLELMLWKRSILLRLKEISQSIDHLKNDKTCDRISFLKIQCAEMHLCNELKIVEAEILCAVEPIGITELTNIINQP